MAKKTKYPVREPKGRDNKLLLRLLGAMGGQEAANRIGLALAAFRSTEAGAENVLIQSGASGAFSALTNALEDPATMDIVEALLYDVWNPQFTLGDGETYDAKKREAWDDLPLRAWHEIAFAYTETAGFKDFLGFYTERFASLTNTGASSTQSKGSTPSDAATS